MIKSSSERGIKKIVIEKRFKYKEFSCVILFTPDGYRCGYVAIPKENNYYEKVDKIDELTCHGGITYQSDKLHNQDDKDVWWIGFDCGHSFDGIDFDRIKELYKDDKGILYLAKIREEVMMRTLSFYKKLPVRSLEYCENECKNIINQILEEVK